MKQVAVITGASSGIGEVFARRLACMYDLILVARRQDRLEMLAAEFRAKHGTKIEVVVADLSVEADVTRVANLIAEEERLGLLVNNAGFGTRGLFWQTDLARMEEMHRLHVMATLKLTHAALGNMVARGAGAVVNVSSVAGFVRWAGSCGYSATKAWMTAFTEGLVLELKAAGSAVQVQALCPGFTQSEFHDVAKVDRAKTAPKSLWLTAEQVVDASLEGLRKRNWLVVPGWQYQWLVALMTKLPAGLRVKAEGLGAGRRD